MSEIVEGLEISRFLEIERKDLQKALHRVLENGDIGTYKNLIQAYERVLGLIRSIEKEDKWETLYSKYNTEGISMVSIWKQKDDNVKDIKQFRLYDNELLSLVINLINQIQMSNFKDENGHELKNNVSYSDLLSYLIKDSAKNFNKVQISESGVTINTEDIKQI